MNGITRSVVSVVAGGVLMAQMFLSGVPLFAQESNAVVSESDEIERLVERSPFQLENAGKDPFRPLVIRVEPKIQVENKQDLSTEKRKDKEPPKPLPPLSLIVQGICGNDQQRIAMVMFENQWIAATKDAVIGGKCRIVDIESDKVVVYSFPHQMRQTFSLK